MNTILIIEEQDINPQAQIGDRDNYFHRRAVRAVVTDNDGAIAIMHATREDYYKLPGGGIDDGEGIFPALERELMEELGSKAIVTGEIGVTIEQRDSWKMTQTSYAYTAKLDGEKGIPDFTDEEIAEGFEVLWMKDIDKATVLIRAGSDRLDNLDVAFMSHRDAIILEAAKTLI